MTTPRGSGRLFFGWMLCRATSEVATGRDSCATSSTRRTFTARDFPGETFRVLKEKETAKFGEYRTRRLVLEAWDRWERGERGDAKTWEDRAKAREKARENGG